LSANFVHLHVHTNHSLLDGVASSTKLINRAKELGMEAIAITDHGNMAAHLEAQLEADKIGGIKVIFGMEAYVVDDHTNHSREQRGANHIILLAKDEVGYTNLVKLNNAAWRDGFYYTPRLDYNLLSSNSDGLIVLSACAKGILSSPALVGDFKTARERAKQLINIFGRENFYIEVQAIYFENEDLVGKNIQELVNGFLLKLAKEMKLKTVLTNDVHFLKKGDDVLQTRLVRIQRESFVYAAPDNWMKTRKEMWSAWKKYCPSLTLKQFKEAANNTLEIADKCNYKIPAEGKFNIPEFDFKSHPDYCNEPTKEEFFRLMLAERLVKKGFHKKKIYKDRLTYELDIITKLGVVDYFLIVEDLFRYVKSKNALCHTRGSVNGSLVAYLLGFGIVDPIKHRILFERFLSPARLLTGRSDIDIDCDFTAEWRGKAIEYLKNKYGRNRVCNVGTYSRMQLKAAIKDMARVEFDETKNEEFAYQNINKITLKIRSGDIEEIGEDEQLLEWYNDNKDWLEKFVLPAVGNPKSFCLHPDTLIQMADGSVKKISDILVGDKVISTSTASLEVDVVTDICHSNTDLFKIELCDKRVIFASRDHKFPVNDLGIIKKVSDIKTSDFLIKPRNIGFFGDLSLKKEYIILLAYLIADGEINSNFFKFTKRIDIKIFNEALNICNSLDSFFVNTRYKDRIVCFLKKKFKISNADYDFAFRKDVNFSKFRKLKRKREYIYSKTLDYLINVFGYRFEKYRIYDGFSRLLFNSGLIGKKSCEKFIPDFIQKLKEEELALFINRLWSCDGTVYFNKNSGINNRVRYEVAYTSTSKILIDQLTLMLQKFGIHTKFSMSDEKTYKIVIINSSLKTFINKIGVFGNKYEKLLKINDYVNASTNPNNMVLLDKLVLVKIKSIEKIFTNFSAIDISVKNNRNFIANGFVSMNSIHAAGIVILKSDVDEWLPIRTQIDRKTNERIMATAWENSHTGREDLFARGIMCLDCLGVKTLSIIQKTIKDINKKYKKKIKFEDIPIDDKKTYKAFSEAETLGVFQLSAPKITAIIKEMKPDRFDDIIALGSLDRPGPLLAKAHVSYTNRKHGEEDIDYMHPSLEPVLNDSYGVPIYSEHLMLAATEFAGMDIVDGERLRQVVKAKDPAIFNSFKERFIKSAIKKHGKGIDTTAEIIWSKLMGFGKYSFPKAHSTSYAYYGNACQYLKVHYPLQFFKNFLNYATHDEYNNIKRVAESKYGVKFIMPDVNKSKVGFSIASDCIRWGLSAVKGLGDKATTNIVESAPYESFRDFYNKVNKRQVNKSKMQILIVVGAFDCFDTRIRIMQQWYELRKEKWDGRVKYFKYTDDDWTIDASELLGVDLVNMNDIFQEAYKNYKIYGFDDFINAPRGASVCVAGKITKAYKHNIKKSGNDMMFIDLIVDGQSISVVCWPDTLQDIKDNKLPIPKAGVYTVIGGSKQSRNGEPQLVMESNEYVYDPITS